MKRFKNILLVLQPAVNNAWALAKAVSLAEPNQAELRVIVVISPAPKELEKEVIAEHFKALTSLTETYRQRLNIHQEVRMGKEFLEVIQAVLRNSHDLVIKVAEKPDFLQRLFGSNDMHLLRKCPCPLWLIKQSESSPYQRILAAVDFNPSNPNPDEQLLNQQIVELASSLALANFASLHLVHVWQPFGVRSIQSRGEAAGKTLAGYAGKEQLLHQNGFRLLGETLREFLGADTYSYLLPQFHLVKGAPQKEIPALVNSLQVDLVVMGTVARSGIVGLLIGNTSEAILEQLTCSVLAIKPAGFVSPVTLPE
jgi:nucleotide-binding universal stress UspA family protein